MACFSGAFCAEGVLFNPCVGCPAGDHMLLHLAINIGSGPQRAFKVVVLMALPDGSVQVALILFFLKCLRPMAGCVDHSTCDRVTVVPGPHLKAFA